MTFMKDKLLLAVQISTSLILFLTGCSNKELLQTELSKAEKEEIRAEIIQIVDDYFEAVKSNDIERILAFWSSSDEFIHAGDGSVFGGYKEWSSYLREWTKPDRIWLYWNNKDIHVVVIDKVAASYTMNFENSFIEKNDTVRVKGSWTYVFRKEGSEWKVIASNGMHKGFTY